MKSTEEIANSTAYEIIKQVQSASDLGLKNWMFEEVIEQTARPIKAALDTERANHSCEIHDDEERKAASDLCAVCLKARVDAVTKSRDAERSEVARLTKCLKVANANHEEFERKWYLTSEELTTLRAEVCEVRKPFEAKAEGY